MHLPRVIRLLGRPDPERRAEAQSENLTVNWQVYVGRTRRPLGRPQIERFALSAAAGRCSSPSFAVPRVRTFAIGRCREAAWPDPCAGTSTRRPVVGGRANSSERAYAASTLFCTTCGGVPSPQAVPWLDVSSTRPVDGSVVRSEDGSRGRVPRRTTPCSDVRPGGGASRGWTVSAGRRPPTRSSGP